MWTRVKEWRADACKLRVWRLGTGEQSAWRKVTGVYYPTLVSNPNPSVLCRYLPYRGSYHISTSQHSKMWKAFLSLTKDFKNGSGSALHCKRWFHCPPILWCHIKRFVTLTLSCWTQLYHLLRGTEDVCFLLQEKKLKKTKLFPFALSFQFLLEDTWTGKHPDWLCYF